MDNSILHKQLRIGVYRPIYLWAGPGTVRMNQLKFLGIKNDEKVHAAAHDFTGSNRVVDTIYSNWVHLSYDWGFPPEIEQDDWDSFKQATDIYHQQGVKVMAYIQTSNCAFQGSYKEKDWYAFDPDGNRVAYIAFAGRCMACFSNPDWIAHLKSMVQGALESGADGIFFDNLFEGDQPLDVFGTWLGPAGCYCHACQEAFIEHSGSNIPTTIRPGNPLVGTYLRWRAQKVADLIGEMVDFIHNRSPGSLVSANDFDPVLRNSYVMYGIDLNRLAAQQDITMIENFGLPKWLGGKQRYLVNNAITLRTAHSIINKRAHLSVLSYDTGIGFDGVYPIRRYRQGIAEAAALGVSATIKGTEYFDGKQMTLLTAGEYAAEQQAIGTYQRWLEANGSIYHDGRENVAPVCLFFPGEDLWLSWHNLAPVYFGACQALTAVGIPWRVIQPGNKLSENEINAIQAVLVFTEKSAGLPEVLESKRVVKVENLKEWHCPTPSTLAQNDWLQQSVARFVRRIMKLYSAKKIVRRLVDGMGIYHLVSHSPGYKVPPPTSVASLLQALPAALYPNVEAPEPVLVDVWLQDGLLQVHLVNYASQPQQIQVNLGRRCAGKIFSPDNNVKREFAGSQVSLDLDTYQILVEGA